MAGACEFVPAATVPEEPQASSPHDPDVAKHGRHGPRSSSQATGGARIVSLAVHAAALGALLLFAAASAALLAVLVLTARAFGHYRGSRYSVPSLDRSSPPRPPLRRKGLSAADLHRLPSFALDGGCRDRETSSSCAVCLEAARAGERWRAMPACRHAFHAACVDQWLATSPACPLCRAAVAVSTS